MRARGSARERCRECERVVVVSARARKLRQRRHFTNAQRPTRCGSSMPQVTYETCDVFATTKFKFGGNPLAVFFLENADQLTSEQMQLLAREVGCKYLCDDCDVTLLRMLTPCRLRNDLRYASRVQRTHGAGEDLHAERGISVCWPS